MPARTSSPVPRGSLAALWILCLGTAVRPFPLSASPAVSIPGPPYRLLLLGSPQAPGNQPSVNMTEIARTLDSHLRVHQVEILESFLVASEAFPDQVRAARIQGALRKALAVVWVKIAPMTGRPGLAELYLHLLDLVSDKALVKTLQLTGQVSPDFHRAAALKILGLLRAALLEVEASRRTQAPLWRLVAPERPGHEMPLMPRQGSPSRGHPVFPSPRRPQLSLGVGYLAGCFGAAEHLHHGLGAEIGLALFRWLEIALHQTVPQPFLMTIPGAHLSLTAYRTALVARFGWGLGPFSFRGEVGGMLLLLHARRTAPAEPVWRRLGVDPGVRVGGQMLWWPLPRLALVASLSADLLGRSQRFVAQEIVLLDLPFVVITAGVGLQVTLR